LCVASRDIGLGLVERDGEPGSGANSFLALQLDLALHHDFDEALADAQAQTTPAILARCARVGLAERLEELSQLLRRNADAGVADPERQSGLFLGVRIETRADCDGTVFGELEAVADQVPENLVEANWISVNEHRREVDVLDDLDVLLGRLLPIAVRDCSDHLAHHFLRVESDDI